MKTDIVDHTLICGWCSGMHGFSDPAHDVWPQGFCFVDEARQEFQEVCYKVLHYCSHTLPHQFTAMLPKLQLSEKQ